MAREYRGSENTHWYASQKTVKLGIASYVGQPIEKVPGAKAGTWVNPTSVHARKYGLVQGCTSVLGEWNKPFLYDWGAKMAALGVAERLDGKTSLAEQYLAGTITKEDFCDAALEARNIIGRRAAAGGTELHKYVELGVQGVPQDARGTAVWEGVRLKLAEHYPGVEWKAEIPAVHEELRFGCRGDLLGFREGRVAAYVDLKTREFGETDVVRAANAQTQGFKDMGRLTPRDTEPLQVAANLRANDPAFEFYDGCGGNLYLSRSTPGALFLATYSKKTLDESWIIFVCLNTIYKIKRGL